MVIWSFLHSMMPMLVQVSLRSVLEAWDIQVRTRVARIAVGANVVSRDSVDQLLQLLFVARLLALANGARHSFRASTRAEVLAEGCGSSRRLGTRPMRSEMASEHKGET